MAPIDLGLSANELEALDEVCERLSGRSKFRNTLTRLLMRWTEFVERTEAGYTDSFFDYTNDLTVRDLLDEVARAAPPVTRALLLDALLPWDERFERATQPVAKPLLDSSVERGDRWRRVPRRLVEELNEDLRERGLLNPRSRV